MTVRTDFANVADSTDFSELYIFGDGFDAILSILEEDDDLESHFTDAAVEVSSKCVSVK